MHQKSSKVTACIKVFGIVQGVGFRPYVCKQAEKFQVTGTVSNKGSFVEIFVSGYEREIEKFYQAFIHQPPVRAMIVRNEIKYQNEFCEYQDFQIIESEKCAGDIFVSPDIATCETCRQELYDPRNRRYMHPFINCTDCGPRMTILESLPYDRIRTCMNEFEMCEKCEKEYHTLHNRRYDAQPVCCHECGPILYLIGREETGLDAIQTAQRTLNEGGIVAVKGIGGFHICCDALNEKSVRRVREIKRREKKPFAVMMRDMDTVTRYCDFSEEASKLLDGYQKPIVLLEKKSGDILAEQVTFENPRLGVMLPYTPLHHLLFECERGKLTTDCLVMTSGNYGGMPICVNDEEAKEYLLPCCDVILSHNRKILIRADDSVTDFHAGKVSLIRRSRGYAPLPIYYSGEGQGLAVGGELKNQICAVKDGHYYMSPYVGNMSGIEALDALEHTKDYMTRVFDIEPSWIACDMHPRYLTSKYAKDLSSNVIEVQHHHAHTVSCMAENDEKGKVIGVVYDGTGYGIDGNIWGGEILLADTFEFQRVASIEPFFQIGGDSSAKEGWKIAVSLIYEIYGENAEAIIDKLRLCSKEQSHMMKILSNKKMNGMTSTSVGRLFDAVSAILNLCNCSTYEGEAACLLEYAAETYEKEIPCHLEVKEENDGHTMYNKQKFLYLPTKKLVFQIIEKYLGGSSSEELAYHFHKKLANFTVEACMEINRKTGINVCTLSGGVFQNRLLLQLCIEGLEKNHMKVLCHHMIPANDGGLALGQAVIAAEQMKRMEVSECV